MDPHPHTYAYHFTDRTHMQVGIKKPNSLSHNKQVEHAAAQGKFNLVTALLKAGGTGASGVRGRGGRTILDAAAKGGNGNVVSAILNAGAKPDLGIRSGKKKRCCCVTREVQTKGVAESVYF